LSLGRSVNDAVLVRLGGHLLVLFDAANTPLSGVSTACGWRIEHQNVSATRHYEYQHTIKDAEHEKHGAILFYLSPSTLPLHLPSTFPISLYLPHSLPSPTPQRQKN